MSLSQISSKHLKAAITEAGEIGYRADEVASAMFSEVIRVWREEKTPTQIADELTAAIDNIDPDTDYTFMRP